MAIKFDRSSCTVVIYCTDHPEWAVLRWAMDAAYIAACGHEKAAHGTDSTMGNAYAQYRHRAAQRAMLPKSA